MRALNCVGVETCSGCNQTKTIYEREKTGDRACLKCLDKNHAVTVEEWLTL